MIHGTYWLIGSAESFQSAKAAHIFALRLRMTQAAASALLPLTVYS